MGRYVYRTKGQGSDGGEVLEYYLGDNALDEMRQDASVKEWLAEVCLYLCCNASASLCLTSAILPERHQTVAVDPGLI